MRFIAYRIKKSSDSETVGTVAFAACWIDSDDQGQASIRASRMIDEHGWQVDAMIENHAVTRSSYSPDDENLRFYEQAQSDGEVLVIYVAKPGDDKGNVDAQ